MGGIRMGTYGSAGMCCPQKAVAEKDGPCGYKVSVRIPQPRNGQIRRKLFPSNIIPKTMSK